MDLERIYTVIKSSVPVLVKKVWFDSPLKPGQWKLNTDGDSVGKPPPPGVGGTMKYDKGNVVLVFSGTCGIGDSNRAEIVAIKEGSK